MTQNLNVGFKRILLYSLQYTAVLNLVLNTSNRIEAEQGEHGCRNSGTLPSGISLLQLCVHVLLDYSKRENAGWPPTACWWLASRLLASRLMASSGHRMPCHGSSKVQSRNLWKAFVAMHLKLCARAMAAV